MKKEQQKLLIIIAVILIVLLIVLLGIKKEDEVLEESIPDELLEQDLENMPGAPEVNFEKNIKPTEVIKGASLVNNKGIVLNEKGEEAQNKGISPNALEAPSQSEVLTQGEIPETAIQITISSDTGFIPNQFKVKPGQVVTIALTAIDNKEHTLRFKDKALMGVALSAANGETRAVTFNAPERMGSYDFICGAPDHRSQEIGQMIVVE